MTEKSLQWQERLGDCARSGLSVQKWCAESGIALHRYYYWRRKLAAPAQRDPSVVEWLQMPAGEAPKLTIRVGAASIEVAAGFDPALLRDVVSALELPRC